MRRTMLWSFAALPALCGGSLGHAQSADSVAARLPEQCARLGAFTIPGTALAITRAERVPAATTPAGPQGPAMQRPAHCLVEGVIERRTGRDGVEYGIGFALALPDDFNGRFLFQGGGGLNGAVRTPAGAEAAGGVPALARGFAVVSTDSGHRGEVFDGSFFADQEASLNFLYRAVGRVTEVAKEIVTGYYAQGIDHSYFVGCSTGGREAMIASQRYPSDFDGIVAGAPAMRTGFSNLGMRWVSTSLNRVAQKDANGRPIAGSALSASDKALVVDSLLETCDAQDGIEDGMIFNTAACDFDPGDLVCGAGGDGECLSPEQAAAVQRAFAGPKDANGDPVYPGYLYDTGIAASGQRIPGLLHGASSPVDPPIPLTEQDVDAEANAAAAEISALGYAHTWTNLSTFSDNGGKLLFYHGISDPWFSALDTLEYYERLGADHGGAEAVRDFSRLFLVPGMGHCGGGEAALDRFDLLTALVDWVENDDAPESVVATGAAFPDRERPLCPYPSYAHYTGGDSNDAANFECRQE